MVGGVGGVDSVYVLGVWRLVYGMFVCGLHGGAVGGIWRCWLGQVCMVGECGCCGCVVSGVWWVCRLAGT